MALEGVHVKQNATAQPVIPVDEDGAALSDDNPANVKQRGLVSAGNTSTTSLIADEVFTGDWQDTLDYGTIFIHLSTDQASTALGWRIEWSQDGSTVDDADPFTKEAGTAKITTFSSPCRYMRVKYTNGGALSTFRLQTILRQGFKDSSHRLDDDLSDNDDAPVRRVVMAARQPDGTYINVEATDTGNLKVSLQVDAASEHKFGTQDAIDKTTRWVVWDKAAAYPAWPGDGVLTVESSASADQGIEINCVGIAPSTGEEISEMIATDGADGQTPVAGSTTFTDGVYRCWVSGGSAPVGFISIKRGAAEIARINIGFGQTEMCRWVVPTIVDGVTYAGCWVKVFTANVGATDKCNLFLVAETPADVMPRVKRYYGNVQGPIAEEFTNGGTIAGIFFPVGTILSVEAIALNTTAEVSASFLAGMALSAP